MQPLCLSSKTLQQGERETQRLEVLICLSSTHPVRDGQLTGHNGYAGGVELNLSRKLGKRNQSEDWLEELCRRVPPAFPNYPHEGGPDDDFLRQIATARSKPSLLDPRMAHVGRCPFCLRRIMQLREEKQSPKLIDPRKAWMVAVAVCCMMLSAALLFHRVAMQPPAAAVADVQILDLSLQGTVRGSTTPQPPVIRLKRNVDKVRILLPLFSEGGAYSVRVLADRDNNVNVAEGTGTAAPVGDKMVLPVTLDLRSAEPGIYFLSTTHGAGEASYYYPVEVVR